MSDEIPKIEGSIIMPAPPSFGFPGLRAPNMPPAPRRRYRPIIETEPDGEDDGDDLEFTHYTCRYDDMEAANEGASALVSLLDDGWAIEDKIVCPPFVTVIFSRVINDEE
jgi:hypothetical protein